MDKTEFIQLHDFEREADMNPDQIIAHTKQAADKKETQDSAASNESDSLLDELGI